MRRILAILLVVLLTPLLAVFAQDDPNLLFNITDESYLDVTDLGFRLYFPEGWTFDNTQGITLIENEDDLEPLTDADDTTNAEGMFIRVLGIPASDIDGFETLTLEDAAEQLLETLGGTETERVEGAVMARRALILVGENENGRAGVLTVWKQPDYLVVATLSTPDMDTLIDYAYSWGYLLGSITPLNTLDLSGDTIDLALTGLSVPYPDGWTVEEGAFGDSTVGVFENPDDIQNTDAAESYIFGVIETDLSTTDFEGDTAMQDFAASLAENQGFDESVTPQEFKILDFPAVTYMGQGETGEYGVFTVVVIDDVAVTLVASAPTEEQFNEFLPTWMWMLQNISQS